MENVITCKFVWAVWAELLHSCTGIVEFSEEQMWKIAAFCLSQFVSDEQRLKHFHFEKRSHFRFMLCCGCTLRPIWPVFNTDMRAETSNLSSKFEIDMYSFLRSEECQQHTLHKHTDGQILLDRLSISRRTKGFLTLHFRCRKHNDKMSIPSSFGGGYTKNDTKYFNQNIGDL